MQYKKLLLLIVLSAFIYLPLSAQGQPAKRSFDIEAFKKKKANFIIEKVNLSDSEAKVFIPLSNEFMDKRFELNRLIRKKAHELRKKSNKSDADYNQLLDAEMNLKMQEAQLEQEYLHKFKKVLSAEKIYKYKKAEEEYMKSMLDQRRERNNSTRNK